MRNHGEKANNTNHCGSLACDFCAENEEIIAGTLEIVRRAPCVVIPFKERQPVDRAALAIERQEAVFSD